MSITNREYPVNIDGLLGQIHAVNHFGNKSYVDKINATTFIIYGSEDKIADRDNIFELHDRLQKSKMLCIDGVGHLPYIEDPDWLNRVICQCIGV